MSCCRCPKKVGLLRKVEGGPTDLVANSSRRPNYQWAFHLSPKQIQERYAILKDIRKQPKANLKEDSSTEEENEERTPFRPVVTENDQWESVPAQHHQEQGTAFSSQIWNSSLQSLEDGSNNSSSSSPHTNLCGGEDQDRENESSRVIFANIHQIGGALDQPTTTNTSSGVPP